MIRTIEIVAWYDIPDDDKNISSQHTAEDITYAQCSEWFGWDEYYQGLRVDVTDIKTNVDEERRKLRKFIG